MSFEDRELPFDFDLLRDLTEFHGPPGYEDRVRGLVTEALEERTDEVRTDAMGNVVGTVEASSTSSRTQSGDTVEDDSDYSVVVAAHIDEIGFMVRHVTDEGFLQLDAVGGWDPRVLRAQRVAVHTAQGELTGVIGSVPPHTQDDEEKESRQEVHDVHVDMGRDGETVSELVSVGDLVTMRQTTEVVGNHVNGKALDDRVCVFAMLEAAERLSDPDVTVHFAATTQEEVGLRGAEALGADLRPDLAIALDATVANDVPGFEDGDQVTRLGEGTAIKLKDGSVITNPKVNRRLREVAEGSDVDYQLEVLPSGGTDTANLQRAGGATPAGALSIPTRYLHTVTESAHVEDIAATTDLLTAFLESEDGSGDYTP